MQSLKNAVDDAIKQHTFHQVSDLSQDEFSDLMVDILESALQSREFKDRLAQEIKEAVPQLR